MLAFVQTSALAAPFVAHGDAAVIANVPNNPSPTLQDRRDVVRLKTGAILRGTIDEKFPGQYVIVTTPLGISRRFTWKEIAYAGSAADLESTIIDLDADHGAKGTDAGGAVHSPASATPSHSRASKVVAAKGKPKHDAGAVQQSRQQVGGSPTVALVIGAAGVVLFGVAMTSAVAWSNKEGELAALCGMDGSCHDDRPRMLTIEEENRVVVLNRDKKIIGTVALVTGVLGLSALVTSGTLLLTSMGREEPPRSAWLLSPAAAGADRGGASLHIRF